MLSPSGELGFQHANVVAPAVSGRATEAPGGPSSSPVISWVHRVPNDCEGSVIEAHGLMSLMCGGSTHVLKQAITNTLARQPGTLLTRLLAATRGVFVVLIFFVSQHKSQSHLMPMLYFTADTDSELRTHGSCKSILRMSALSNVHSTEIGLGTQTCTSYALLAQTMTCSCPVAVMAYRALRAEG